jgi:methionyl aminopeptidase
MNDPIETYNNIRRAAEVHRQARQYARKVIKPGMTMIDVANTIEDSTRALVEEDGLDSGVGFPTGLSLNDCAAHYTPNPTDKRSMCILTRPLCRRCRLPVINVVSCKVLEDGDIMKVDIGVHVKGRIVDSAFTLSWNPEYENLLKAVKDATDTGVRVSAQLVWTRCPLHLCIHDLKHSRHTGSWY